MSRKETKRTGVAAGVALALFGPAAAQETPVNSGFANDPALVLVEPGADFCATGATTRHLDDAVGGVLQSEPFFLEVQPPPADAVIRRIAVTWNYLLNGDAPSEDTIRLNGIALEGELVAYGAAAMDNAKGGTASYAAFLYPNSAPVFHGVSNEVANATDKPLGDDPMALGAGLSVVTLYSYDPSAQKPVQRVEVHCGFTATGPDDAAATVSLDVTDAGVGSSVHLLLNALDGESGSDRLILNGDDVSGTLLGTGAPGNAWIGLLGPLASGRNRYDHADDVIPAAVKSGEIELRTLSVDDSVAHTLAVLTVVPAQAFESVGPGKAGGQGLVPTLYGQGPMTPFSQSFLLLKDAQSGLAATLVVGAQQIDAPLMGGILGPQPSALVGGFLTGGSTATVVPIPPDLTPGLELFAQFWIADPAASFGVSASNTLKATVQAQN